ncbi:mCG1036171 [Mus musculus]|nr:mCG1036171 [Mus musculus]
MWLLGFELQTFGRAVGCSYPLSHLTSPCSDFQVSFKAPLHRTKVTGLT